MAETNQKLSSELEKRGASQTQLSLKERARDWKAKNLPRLQEVMGSHDEAVRLYSITMDCVSRNPMLLKCEPTTIFNALLQCAYLKAYPGPLNEAALVPFYNSKKQQYECQFMPMYPLLVKHAYNSGVVKGISTDVVYTNDEFTYQKGTEERLYHVPAEVERGELRGAYAIVKTVYGETLIKYMPMAEIMKFKARSRAADKEYSPWSGKEQTDFEWMCKKTVLKQLLKLLPKSVELSRALQADSEIESPELKKEVIIPLDEQSDDTVPPVSDELTKK